jgi:tripartite-type tricarboxylate transporter receptor subunit TctC
MNFLRFAHTRFIFALLFLMMACSTSAQTSRVFPNKPVRIVVGLGPGSSMDLVARTLGPALTEIWGQPVVIENKVGAAGNIAADLVARATDGHTLLFAQNAITISASLYPKLGYDLRRDLRPVTQLTAMPHVIVTNLSVPVKTLAELFDLAKSSSTQLNLSSAGVGNADHMAAELLAYKAGVRLVHIPYTSGSLAMNALIAGDVQIYLPGLPVSLNLIQSGKIRALAVTGASRSDALPQVPTVQESGMTGFQTVLWYGLFAPSVMNLSEVEKIAQDVGRALQTSLVKDKLRTTGIDAVGNSPTEFKSFVDAEIDRWAEIVRERRLQPE